MQDLANGNRSGLQPRLMRFSASILFLDIVGFTPFVERLTQEGQEGAERLSRLLNSYFGEIIDLIAAYGGVVIRFAGDAMIAIWPARERSLGVTVRDAVRCARALQEKMSNYFIAEQMRLFLKVNVEAGEIISALVGGQDGHWEFFVSGNPSLD
jgi:class 3 adenylate cyclase